MPQDKGMASSVKFTLPPQFVRDMESACVDLWIDVAANQDIEYEKTEIKDHIIAIPVDEADALLKQFGSATLGIKALFWFEKAKKEFKARAGEVKF